jgi:hypothetical protein
MATDEARSGDTVRHRWSASDRLVPRAVVRPAQRFADTEASGAVVMLAAAVLAVAWANSPWQETYFELWNTELAIHLGDLGPRNVHKANNTAGTSIANDLTKSIIFPAL